MLGEPFGLDGGGIGGGRASPLLIPSCGDDTPRGSCCHRDRRFVLSFVVVGLPSSKTLN